jgi:hypothetical protein
MLVLAGFLASTIILWRPMVNPTVMEAQRQCQASGSGADSDSIIKHYYYCLRIILFDFGSHGTGRTRRLILVEPGRAQQDWYTSADQQIRQRAESKYVPPTPLRSSSLMTALNDASG